MRGGCVLALAGSLLSGVSAASAFEVTIERAGSVAAAPTSSVARNELAPPPGVQVAPERVRAAYEPEFRARSTGVPATVPVPVPNPVAVSFCPSDIL